MSSSAQDDITEILRQADDGDDSAVNRLMPLVYKELRALAESYLARERLDHTLLATALVHEAYVRLVKQENVQWRSRAHFFAVAAQAIRQILVDHARGISASSAAEIVSAWSSMRRRLSRVTTVWTCSPWTTRCKNSPACTSGKRKSWSFVSSAG